VPDSSRPLSVVVVTWQSAHVVAQCIAALPEALEDAGAWQLVVVDNASTDDTLDVVEAAAPRANVIRRPDNGGFAAGVNTGVAAAPGCDVLVLNPDVRLAPRSVAVLRAAATIPGTGIVVPALTDAQGTLQNSLRRRPTVLRALGEALVGGTWAGRFAALGETVVDPGVYARPGRHDWATGAAWLITRDCLDAVGSFEERFLLYSEETEFALRAADFGFALRFEPAARAVHLGGEVQSSARLWSLLTANRVRLHRERHGRAAASAMRGAVALNEALRCIRGPDAHRHRVALRGLVRLHRWPPPLGGDDPGASAPGYVCFSAQDWWYHNQAHSDFQLMTRIAVHRKVLLVNSIGLRMPLPGRSTQFVRRLLRKAGSVAKLVRRPLPDVPGFHVMTPVMLPLYGSASVRRLNAALIRAQVTAVYRWLRLPADPVVVVTIPTAWDVIEPMRRRSLLYNRSDRHSEFPESDRAIVRALEEKLLAQSDVILYVSRQLMADERALTGDRAVFLDHGVDLRHFTANDALPADLEAIPRPRAGFFGGLDDYLVDFDLLERVAAELPDVSLVLIGDATCSMSRFEKYPNVHWLGYRPYAEIPAYGSGFDVALMPWLDNDWIRVSNPIKMKEYLALGLAVVSTDFPEVHHYDSLIRVATDPHDFVTLLRKTLADGGLLDPEARRSAVLGASWSARVSQLTELAERARHRRR